MKIDIQNCMDCPNRIVVPDPDPDDRFCDDDEAVLCGLTKGNGSHPARCPSVAWAHKPVTVSCRPHHKRDECGIPDWCPLATETSIEALKVALRVLTAISEHKHPQEEDVKALKGFAPLLAEAPLDELACDVIQQAMQRRSLALQPWVRGPFSQRPAWV